MNRNREFYIRKALFASKLALAAILVFMVVKLFLPYGSSLELPPSPLSGDEGLPPRLTDSAAAFDYSRIIERNIFGGPKGTSHVSSLGIFESAELKSTDEQLGLSLLGTIAGAPEVSRAIIKNVRTSIVGLYKIGDAVAQTTVEVIDRDGVVLNHQGQRRRLYFNTANAAPSSLLERAQPQSFAEPAVAQPPAAMSGASQIEMILDSAVMRPRIVNNSIDGLVLSGLNDVPAARNLGLKDGDIIRRVNSQLLTSKQQAFQVLMKARGQHSATIDIMRDSRNTTITVPMRSK